jgi:hypothetical protein
MLRQTNSGASGAGKDHAFRVSSKEKRGLEYHTIRFRAIP